ncbi:oxidoreductase-like domain-containing protein 1 [Scaptodrosophila lebanonensis]|uniref:Oxidoreductase-like domain-containing protein 1 n=1 Tax=Drosophila lebanonensis TaxID=7225 RepID=A0A6J2T1H2_DROLE|nr:oxidoreductase-like domain-containing protein 1 [Scaptodrosophila lebanonensis]
MLAALCFSCPRCLLLRRGGARLPGTPLPRGLADQTAEEIVIPPEPTTCCMSGCANCVWLDYAQTLSKILDNNDERAREIVLSRITDPNLKMFLSLELRNLKLMRETAAAAEEPKAPN